MKGSASLYRSLSDMSESRDPKCRSSDVAAAELLYLLESNPVHRFRKLHNKQNTKVFTEVICESCAIRAFDRLT